MRTPLSSMKWEKLHEEHGCNEFAVCCECFIWKVKAPSRLIDTVPDGVVLDRQHTRREQLEFLVQLDSAASSGQLQPIMEHRRVGLILQRPACTGTGLAEVREISATCMSAQAMG